MYQLNMKNEQTILIIYHSDFNKYRNNEVKM